MCVTALMETLWYDLFQAKKVVDWLKDLLNGLVFLESQCVVHRDLKLNNLLLTTDGKMIICDFGKAIAMEPEDHFTMKFTSGGELSSN